MRLNALSVTKLAWFGTSERDKRARSARRNEHAGPSVVRRVALNRQVCFVNGGPACAICCHSLFAASVTGRKDDGSSSELDQRGVNISLLSTGRRRLLFVAMLVHSSCVFAHGFLAPRRPCSKQ